MLGSYTGVIYWGHMLGSYTGVICWGHILGPYAGVICWGAEVKCSLSHLSGSCSRYLVGMPLDPALSCVTRHNYLIMHYCLHYKTNIADNEHVMKESTKDRLWCQVSIVIRHNFAF